MQFNPDQTKQAVQFIFSQKRIKPTHPPIYSNENQVVAKKTKTSRLDFGFWPYFPQPFERKDNQCKKGYLCNQIPIKYVSRDVLDQKYKLYVRRHLDYGEKYLSQI